MLQTVVEGQDCVCNPRSNKLLAFKPNEGHEGLVANIVKIDVDTSVHG